jgi:hypothetical protein
MKKPPVVKPPTARQWFRANGYDDVFAMTDEAHTGWDAEGSKERRDWFRICAGAKGGKPRKVRGRTFPVLRAFQIRQGLPVTSNAIWRSPNEVAPPIVKQARWAKKRRRKSAKKKPYSKS